MLRDNLHALRGGNGDGRGGISATVKTTISNPLKALQKKKYRNLFAANVDPTALLQELEAGNAGLGSIMSSDLGAPDQNGSVTAAHTVGILGSKSVPGPNGTVIRQRIFTGATQYYHSDHLSARMMTDSSGNKIGEQEHYPFGESWYLTNTTTKWQFTSYERDAESANDYAMARYSVNRLGRFSSPDSLGGSAANPQSLDRFAYVANDPVDFIDPSGRLCVQWTIYHVAQYIGNIPLFDWISTEIFCFGNLHLSFRDDSGHGGERGNDGNAKPQTPPPCLAGAGPLAPGQSRCAPQKQSYADCVKDLANVGSIQNLTHAGNGFLASAFLSNTFSSGIQLVQDLSNLRLSASGNDIARTALSNGAAPLAQSAARNIPNVAVSVTAASATFSPTGVSVTQASASYCISALAAEMANFFAL